MAIRHVSEKSPVIKERLEMKIRGTQSDEDHLLTISDLNSS